MKQNKNNGIKTIVPQICQGCRKAIYFGEGNSVRGRCDIYWKNKSYCSQYELDYVDDEGEDGDEEER